MIIICAACGEATGPVWATKKYCSVCLPFVRLAASRAANKVATARYRGDIAFPFKSVCVDCGKPAKEHDHRHYLRPLEVDPVCVGCNVKRGPAKDIAEAVSRLKMNPSDGLYQR